MTTPNLASAGVAKNSRPHFQDVGGRVPSAQYPADPGAVPQQRLFSRKPRHYGSNSTNRDMFPNGGMIFPSFQSTPRSFEELHAERIYLLTSLQGQNAQATELLRKITNIEETIPQAHRNGDLRRLSKRLAYYRSSLRETTGQEKAILGRLGELACEIQMRERMTQIENERRQREQVLSRLAMYQNLPQMEMNPTSQVFYQQGYPMPYFSWSQQQYQNGGYFWPQSPQYNIPESLAQYQGPNVYYQIQNWAQGNDYNLGTIKEGHEEYEKIRGEEEQKKEPPIIQRVGRTASLSKVWSDLTYSATNTTHCAISVLKRHSVPESDKAWLDKEMG